MGFSPAGVWRHAGFKLQCWWDVGVWQKELQPAAHPPPPVVPFAEMTRWPALSRLLADVPAAT